jgi:predicted Zn-dependent protease
MVSEQERFDDAMFDFSRGEYAQAVEKLQAMLKEHPEQFDAQLALGMAYYRLGDLPRAITEGHKAEKLRPREQLVHTNLSLFYMRAGDRVTAEHHGLQARLAGWRQDAQRAKNPEPPGTEDPELALAKPKLEPVKIHGKVPDMPWKKKKNPAPDPGSKSES